METQEARQPRVIRLVTLMVIVMAISTIVIGFIAARWAFQSSEVLIIKNSPVPVQPPEVRDGGKVFLTIDFCKNSNVKGTTEVNLVGEIGGAKIAVSWPPDGTTKQCAVLKEIPVPIPAQTPTDKYHAEFTTCYKVNPLKGVKCNTFRSQSFKVINSKLNPGDAQVLDR